MPVILGKSKSLKPGEGIREIRYRNVEQNGIELAKNIAREFGQQSKKMKPKKFLIR
jgi:hypothetical protein